MIGLDRHTARPIGFDAHLRQSVADVLSTPRGSLVMEREYGSDLPDLVDAPINGATAVDLFQATAEAIDRWEPRLVLTRVEIPEARPGAVVLRLSGDVDGAPTVIDVALGLPAAARETARQAGEAL